MVVEIAGRKIGPSFPCFVIAEAGVNHNGDLTLACRLVDAAVECGADAVKFQTFKSDKLIAAHAPKADYQLETTGADEDQLQMLKRLELSFEAFRELYAYCQAKKILFLSTPFDEESADFLDALGMEAFKIGSGEITNLPFLEYVASKGKPMIISTGMSYLSEVETAIRVIDQAGNPNIVLLHCTSDYPASASDANLRAMHTMAVAFGKPVGYSDHTSGTEVSFAAVSLGASLIEKHFTVDRNLPGPDHRASLEPQEFSALVRGVRIVEAALGHGRKEPAACELSTKAVARKSLVAARDIAVGTVLTDDLIAVKRPGTGLQPEMRRYLIGRTVCVPISADALFALDMLT